MKWWREGKRKEEMSKEEKRKESKGARVMVREKNEENSKAFHLRSKVHHNLCVRDPSRCCNSILSDTVADYQTCERSEQSNKVSLHLRGAMQDVCDGRLTAMDITYPYPSTGDNITVNHIV
jgi:hypothetical protein